MMLNLAPEVRDHFGLVVEQHQIVRPESGSRFKPISSEAELRGRRAFPRSSSRIEIHARKTRDLHDNLRSMAAKLPYSRQVVISTPGFDMSPQAIGYEVYCYARDILLGAIKDDSQFALLIEADRDLDPWAPETWRQANFNLGVSIDPVEVANEANEARQVPSKQPSFFTKRLGWWCQSASTWIEVAALEKCADLALKREQFSGGTGYIGVDLGRRSTSTAIVEVFCRTEEDGLRHYYAFTKAYLAEESKTLRDGNDTLRVWADEGWLQLTPGQAMEIGIVHDDIVEALERNPGAEVCLDPWGAVGLVQSLAVEGYEKASDPDSARGADPVGGDEGARGGGAHGQVPFRREPGPALVHRERCGTG